MLVCEALKTIDQKKYSEGVKKLSEALELFPANKETRFYNITVLVNQFQDEQGSDSLLEKITTELNNFIQEKKNEHMLYYFRGILNLYKQDFMLALKDFEKVHNQ